MTRLTLAAILAFAVCLSVALVVAPQSTAAQKVAAMEYGARFPTLRQFASPDGTASLEIEFRGADGWLSRVRVIVPPRWDQVQPLKVRFDDAPAGTRYRACAPFTDPPPNAKDLPWNSCRIYTNTTVTDLLVQTFSKRVSDFGGKIEGGTKDIYVSVLNLHKSPDVDHQIFPNPNRGSFSTFPYEIPGVPIAEVPELVNMFGATNTAVLQVRPRWSKFYSGTRTTAATHHFPLLFGSLTYFGLGVWGPGNRFGSPTNGYGRNVYIDTLDSDYGPGWRRVMGILTQPPNGTFCYEFAKKGGSSGKTGISTKNRYRLTAIGPSMTPVISVNFSGPTFAYGGPNYNPLTEQWGTNFSPEQAAALRQQAVMMGDRWRLPVKGTDCAQTLRQLPESFYTPAG